VPRVSGSLPFGIDDDVLPSGITLELIESRQTANLARREADTSILPAAAAIAARTNRIRIASGALLMPSAKLPDDWPPRRSVNATELLSQLPLCQSGVRLPDQLS